MKDAAYKNYLLGVLTVIVAFNYVDRLAFGLLLQDIKVDLSLSDTQLGLLGGIAFFLFYSVMGVPIARWADRGNRVTIITITTAVWSAAVALCGFAGSFLHLMLVRIGVAIGEAGCVPPAHSLIADYFTRAERPRAVAIYKLGVPLSVVIGFLLAGWLNELYGWRTAFVMLGLPGLGLAAVAWFTLIEPRQTRRLAETVAGTSAAGRPVEAASHASQQTPSMKQVCVVLWSNVTFRNLLFGYSVVSFFGSGVGQWNSAYFIRSFGFQTGELGTWFAIVLGGAGFLGTYLGGMLASRYAALNETLQLRATAVICCFFGFISSCTYLAPSAYIAFFTMGLAVAGMSAVMGPLFATIQTLVPDRMRATSIAILFLLANLIGMGLGPLAAGMLSDALRPVAGEQSLRYALLILCPGNLWAAWHLWRASRTVLGDLEAVQAASDEGVRREREVAADGTRLHRAVAKAAS